MANGKLVRSSMERAVEVVFGQSGVGYFLSLGDAVSNAAEGKTLSSNEWKVCLMNSLYLPDPG